MRFLLVLAFLAVQAVCGVAAAATVAVAVAPGPMRVLGAEMERLDGAPVDATIQDVLSPTLQARFRPVGTPKPIVMPGEGTVWLRVTLDLPAIPAFQITANAIRPDVVDLYAVDHHGLVVRHVAGGLESRDRVGRWFTLALNELGDEQVTVYLRMRTRYVSTGSMRVETIERGVANERSFERAMMLLLGAVPMAVLIFAAMWWRVGGGVNRWGTVMTLCAMPLAQVYLGLDRVLWPTAMLAPDFNHWFYQTLMGSYYAALLLFTLHLLQLDQRKRIARVVRGLAPILVAGMATAPLLENAFGAPLAAFCITAALIMGLFLCGTALYTRSQDWPITLAFALPTALSLGVQTAASMQLLLWKPIWQWLVVVPLVVTPLASAALLADLVRRRLQTLVRERTQALVEAIESRDRVLRLVAHDLRNPVGSIHAASELLLSAKPGDTTRVRLLQAVQTGSEAALRLMDDLLDVVAIERGAVKIEPRQVEASAWLRQRCEVLRLTAARKSLLLKVEADSPCWGYFDPARTGQALDNLVSNALKFSPPGSTVTVSLEARPEELVFRVRDQGPGIEEAELQRLFQEFETGQARPTAGERSTGLGLSIARTLVHAQDGRITVESVQGQGSCFALHMPRTNDSAALEPKRLDALA